MLSGKFKARWHDMGGKILIAFYLALFLTSLIRVLHKNE